MDTNIIDMGIYAKTDDPDQTLFDRLLNENMAEAVLRSIGQYLKITSDEIEDFDTINREMADVTMPDDLAARLQEINRKYIEEYNARTSSDDENNNDDIDFPNAPVYESSENIPKTSVYDESDNSMKMSVVRGSGSENEVIETDRNDSRKVIRMKAFRKCERAMRSFSKVAVVFIAIVGITFTSFSVDADAMRFSLYDIFIKHNDRSADVSIVQNHDPTGLYTEHLQNNDPPEQLPETVGEVKLTDYFEPGEEILYPGYLPNQVILCEIEVNDFFCNFTFSNNGKDAIRYKKYKSKDSNLNIDSEYNVHKIIYIDDKEVLLEENEKYIRLCWNENGQVVLKASKEYITEETIICIADSMKKMIIS